MPPGTKLTRIGVSNAMSNATPNAETPSKGSPWALRLATVAGIPVRLHLTFLLFVGWAALSGGWAGAALFLGLFLCVVLHEFGHALAARRYGIETRDIVLYPIG